MLMRAIAVMLPRFGGSLIAPRLSE